MGVLHLSIAGVRFELRSDEPLPGVMKCYAAFATTDEAADWTFEVRSTSTYRAVDTLLRTALQLDVHARGGCLVHAAAVVIGGRAHLFPGRSGSGKSTLAALASHSLCDELCVVLPRPGGLEVHGTPWWRGQAGSARLAGVYQLAWDAEEVSWRSRGEGLRHLACNLVLPFDGPGERAAAFAAAGRIATQLPFGRLAFRRDSDVDALLRRAEAMAA